MFDFFERHPVWDWRGCQLRSGGWLHELIDEVTVFIEKLHELQDDLWVRHNKVSDTAILIFYHALHDFCYWNVFWPFRRVDSRQQERAAAYVNLIVLDDLKSQARWLFILICLRLLPYFALLSLYFDLAVPCSRWLWKKNLLRHVNHPNIPS